MRLILALFLAGLFFLTSVTEAGSHHNGPKLPGIPHTPLIVEGLYDDGVIVWDVSERAANYPGFVEQLQQVNDYAAIVSGIPHRRALPGERPEIIHTMPQGFPCGQAAACIYYASPLPVVVAYNYRLGYTDWRSAQCHEGTNSGHAMGLHEHYDDINFRSLGRTWTCMDFGTGVWQMTPYDVQMVHSWLLPQGVKGYGLRYHPDGTPYVFYCGELHPYADRVALMVTDPEGNWYWTGVHLPRAGSCENGAVGFNIIPGPGWCFWLNVEISGWAESWLRGDMRNDTLVGCT